MRPSPLHWQQISTHSIRSVPLPPQQKQVWLSVVPVPLQPGQTNISTTLTVPAPRHLVQTSTRLASDKSLFPISNRWLNFSGKVSIRLYGTVLTRGFKCRQMGDSPGRTGYNSFRRKSRNDEITDSIGLARGVFSAACAMNRYPATHWLREDF
jgi:hypothetical protein